MKRSAVGLEQVADWHLLTAAFHRALRAASDSQAALRFSANLPDELTALRSDIIRETVAVGQMTAFCIRDPKPRLIHAPCFRERVLHHAVMAQVGPVLDRSLVDDTYACRTRRGSLAAVRRCQQHTRRFDWYAQIDIASYFASIDHAVLNVLLRQKLKNAPLQRLLQRIIDAFHSRPEKGLPIGALTSQHFANFYLAGLDRVLIEQCRVQGLVRYMDDLVWFGPDKESVKNALAVARAYVGDELLLEIKQTVQIGRSRNGLRFCGFRILPGALRVSRRRKRGYIAGRRRWEGLFNKGSLHAHDLQAAYGSVLGATVHADAVAWRREQLQRSPVAGLAAQL